MEMRGAYDDEREEPSPIGREVFPRDGFNAGRKLAVGIAPGNADCLRSQVYAEQNAARWKMCSGLRKRQDDGHALAVPRRLQAAKRRHLGHLARRKSLCVCSDPACRGEPDARLVTAHDMLEGARKMPEAVRPPDDVDM